jgi:hypothetical protein
MVPIGQHQHIRRRAPHDLQAFEHLGEEDEVEAKLAGAAGRDAGTGEESGREAGLDNLAGRCRP